MKNVKSRPSAQGGITGKSKRKKCPKKRHEIEEVTFDYDPRELELKRKLSRVEERRLKRLLVGLPEEAKHLLESHARCFGVKRVERVLEDGQHVDRVENLIASTAEFLLKLLDDRNMWSIEELSQCGYPIDSFEVRQCEQIHAFWRSLIEFVRYFKDAPSLDGDWLTKSLPDGEIGKKFHSHYFPPPEDRIRSGLLRIWQEEGHQDEDFEELP